MSEKTPWRRWKMEELEPADGGGTRSRERPDARRDETTGEAFQHQAELQALREKVQQEAHDKGRAAGYQAGQTQGYNDGHAEGLAEGRRRAEAELQERIQAAAEPLGELAGAFSAALSELDEQISQDLVDLALATGHQLAGEAIAEQPEQVLTLIRSLLHTDPPLIGHQRLWLNPSDRDLVAEHLREELDAAGWTLQPDDQISRGGCRVTSANGELDATWESRWAAVKAQVRHRQPQTEQPPGGHES